MSLVLFVVGRDLTLALLVDFNFKSTLARPLLSKVLVKFFYTTILKFFALR